MARSVPQGYDRGRREVLLLGESRNMRGLLPDP